MNDNKLCDLRIEPEDTPEDIRKKIETDPGFGTSAWTKETTKYLQNEFFEKVMALRVSTTNDVGSDKVSFQKLKTYLLAKCEKFDIKKLVKRSDSMSDLYSNIEYLAIIDTEVILERYMIDVSIDFEWNLI
ncbi:hypothetical protein QA601_15965 [Chitinispirillales bacterium ANBcel5]|uniref:hypothetical protein n=1 Tax=Cellulosispirillum alkaliphilum TaxID=3039283 RepID=UPI002A4EB02F|nr:hypothetical protein [Chitinispirillales bacterium ANBcel5]